MKTNVLILFFLFSITLCYAQIDVKNTGKVVVAKNTYLIVSNNGDYTNTASAQTSVSGFMTISGTTVNNAGTTGITVTSTPTNDGSLILNSANVQGKVQRYLSNDCYHYISSPIKIANTNVLNILTPDFYKWNAAMQWNGLSDFLPWGTTFIGNLNVTSGYAYHVNATQTLNFEGELNVDNYTFNLLNSGTGDPDNQGWNFIGNPYTSCLNWDLIVDDNPSLNIEKAIYYFDDADGSAQQSNYKYYVAGTGTGTGNANNIIPLAQGFFVKTAVNNQSFIINSANRLHSNAQMFFKNNDENENIIRAIISNSTLNDEFVIRFIENATKNFDGQYDARKLFPSNTEIPMIYSFTNDNKLSSINSIPLSSDNFTIPLGIKAEIGNYKIIFTEYLIDNYNYIYFHDKQLNIYKEISENLEYSFYHEGGSNEIRFEIVCSQIQLSDIEIIKNLTWLVYPNPATEFINIDFDKIPEKLEIYDVLGKKIYENSTVNNSNTINIKPFANGVYFIKSIFENNIIEIKKLIIK